MTTMAKLIIVYILSIAGFITCVLMLANSVIDSLKEEGLKNIVTEIWEGEKQNPSEEGLADE